jgi:hypothetical protein
MADLSITAANCVKFANAVEEQGYAGETITAGQPCYRDASTGLYMKSDSNSATVAARSIRGIAMNSASLGQPLSIQKSGDITLGATLVANTAYYLSDTAGGICPLADVGAGEYTSLVGIAISTSVLRLAFVYTGVSN